MSERLIDAIDAVLTVLFWLPAKLLHYEKCPRCTIRVRYYEALLLLTRPLRRWDLIDHYRIDWELRTAVEGVVSRFRKVQLEESSLLYTRRSAVEQQINQILAHLPDLEGYEYNLSDPGHYPLTRGVPPPRPWPNPPGGSS